jgi:hypothetical protein
MGTLVAVYSTTKLALPLSDPDPLWHCPDQPGRDRIKATKRSGICEAAPPRRRRLARPPRPTPPWAHDTSSLPKTCPILVGGHDSRSMAFLNTPGMELLYSDVARGSRVRRGDLVVQCRHQPGDALRRSHRHRKAGRCGSSPLTASAGLKGRTSRTSTGWPRRKARTA